MQSRRCSQGAHRHVACNQRAHNRTAYNRITQSQKHTFKAPKMKRYTKAPKMEAHDQSACNQRHIVAQSAQSAFMPIRNRTHRPPIAVPAAAGAPGRPIRGGRAAAIGAGGGERIKRHYRPLAFILAAPCPLAAHAPAGRLLHTPRCALYTARAALKAKL